MHAADGTLPGGSAMVQLHPILLVADLLELIFTIGSGEPSPVVAEGFQVNEVTASQLGGRKYHSSR